MGAFEYKKLRVYAEAIHVTQLAFQATRRLPRHCWPLGDQLMRAAFSIVLNIAEGGGEFTPREKARFYRMARRSAAEASAAFDVLCGLDAISREVAAEADLHLEAIGGMLTKMVKVVESRNTRRLVHRAKSRDASFPRARAGARARASSQAPASSTSPAVQNP